MEFGRLKAVWDELQTELRRSGEKPLRFLHYFIFSRYEVEQLREDAIYNWLKQNEERVGLGKQPITLSGILCPPLRRRHQGSVR